MQQPHDESARPVDGIEYPGKTVAGVMTKLLTQNPVGRIALTDRLPHSPLGRAIRLGHRVVASTCFLVVDS